MKKEIRIEIETGPAGCAPQPPINIELQATPAFWRGEAADVDVMLFEDPTAGTRTVATMTNVTEMKMEISDTADHATPDISLTATVANTRLDLTVIDADWLARTARHARFPIAKGDINVTMDGATQKSMFMRITALDDGEWIVLAQGQCTVHEAGAWPV